MKKGIHPELKECKVKCACGYEFTTKSTLEEIQLETWPKCHSFILENIWQRKQEMFKNLKINME